MSEAEIQEILARVAIQFAPTPFALWFPSLYPNADGTPNNIIYRIRANKIIVYGKINEIRDQPERRVKQYKLIITGERRIFKAIIEKFEGRTAGFFPRIKGHHENFMEHRRLGKLSLIVLNEPNRPYYVSEVLDALHYEIGGAMALVDDRERFLARLFRAYVGLVTELHRESRPNSFCLSGGMLEIDDIFLPQEEDPDGSGFIPTDVSATWDACLSPEVPYFLHTEKLNDLRWSTRILVALLLKQPFVTDKNVTEADLLRVLEPFVASNNVSQLAAQYARLPTLILNGTIPVQNPSLPMEPLMHHEWFNAQA